MLRQDRITRTISAGFFTPDGDGKKDGLKGTWKAYEWQCDEQGNTRWRDLKVVVDYRSYDGLHDGGILGVKNAYAGRWRTSPTPLTNSIMYLGE